MKPKALIYSMLQTEIQIANPLDVILELSVAQCVHGANQKLQRTYF